MTWTGTCGSANRPRTLPWRAARCCSHWQEGKCLRTRRTRQCRKKTRPSIRRRSAPNICPERTIQTRQHTVMAGTCSGSATAACSSPPETPRTSGPSGRGTSHAAPWSGRKTPPSHSPATSTRGTTTATRGSAARTRRTRGSRTTRSTPCARLPTGSRRLGRGGSCTTWVCGGWMTRLISGCGSFATARLGTRGMCV